VGVIWERAICKGDRCIIISVSIYSPHHRAHASCTKQKVPGSVMASKLVASALPAPLCSLFGPPPSYVHDTSSFVISVRT